MDAPKNSLLEGSEGFSKQVNNGDSSGYYIVSRGYKYTY